jgi:hypothetical protein
MSITTTATQRRRIRILLRILFTLLRWLLADWQV